MSLNQVITLINSNKLNDASVALEGLIKKNSTDSYPFFLLGLVLNNLGKPNEAINHLNKSLSLNSRQEAAWGELGIAQLRSGFFDKAASSFLKSISIKDNYQAHSCLGDIYAKQGNFAKAIEHYSSALKYNIQDWNLFKNLGIVLYNTHQTDKAFEFLGKSLAINPNQQRINQLVGNMMVNSEHNLKGIEYLKKELELGTNTPDIYMDYGNALQKLGKAHEGAEFYKKGLRMRPFKEGYSHLLFIMHHDPLATNADFRAIAEECYNTCLAPVKKEFNGEYDFSNRKTKNTNEKIRVAFISKRFRSGLADYWALAILKEIDKSKFEFVFYQDSTHEDHGTQEFKDLADEWKVTETMNHKQIADLVYQDKIDIFVDLVGHIGGGRLEVFTLKPAPIQVCWINYYGTLAMPEMDYFIADKNIVTEEAEKYFTETVYKMPDVFNPFTPKLENVEITQTIPFKKNGYIRFGSMNRYTKINSEVLELWAKILKQIPSSKLYMTAPVFKEIEMQEHFKQSLEALGVERERIEIEPFPNLNDFFNRFNEIDILLDPFPFTGGSTSIDSTFMGVPTITLDGSTWVHRSGVVTMLNIGCPELIAKDKDDYFNKVIELAADIPRLERYRQEMRSRLLNSPICDNKLYGQNMQKAYEFMWDKFSNS